MNIKIIFAFVFAAALSCASVSAAPGGEQGGGPGGQSGEQGGPGGESGGPGGESGGPGGESGGPGGESGEQGGSGGTLTYDDFISVTTNANCIVREGTLYGYTSSLTTSVAPTAAAGVTALAAGVFSGNTAITTVNLSNTSITEIPSDCFAGCTSLSSVMLPASCTAIGANAFAGCTALATMTASGVKSVGSDAFRGCTALAATVGVGDATTFGDYAYANSGVTSVDLDGVDAGEGAFSLCTSLTSASNLPEQLPAAVFAGCTALATTDYKGVSNFGDASLAGIPATSLTIDDGATLGAYALAADEATVATSVSGDLTRSSCDTTAFLGRDATYMVDGETMGVEALELVKWLIAKDTAVTQPTDGDGKVSYACSALESWLSDSSNEAAIMEYCYDDETAATDVLTVDGTTFTFTESGAASIAVAPVATYDLADDFDVAVSLAETETTGVYTATPEDSGATESACFMRLKFSKNW